MLKVLAIVAALWVGAIYSEVCKYTDQQWGDANPNLFYFCNPITNEAEVSSCSSGSGYADDGQDQGCMPWSQWSSVCVPSVDVSTFTCTSDINQPQPMGNPNSFLLCVGDDPVPKTVLCPEGTGFFVGKYYMGCIPWASWRTISGCILVENGDSK